MGVVLQICGDALGKATEADGEYLYEMDFEARDGLGALTTTPDIGEAMQFDDLPAAFAYLRRSPECHPIRLSDGQPNRPLTAWNWQLCNPKPPADRTVH